MRILISTFALALAACSPPAQTKTGTSPTEAAQEATTPSAPAAEFGPYGNSWDSDEFVRFNHTLRAEAPGRHLLTLEARTEGGTQTVAVYPADANGERAGGRLVFAIATASGQRETREIDVPQVGVPVVVVVENASGRQSTGTYTLTVEPAAP